MPDGTNGFQEEALYTVTTTLTANSGYTFTPAATASINGRPVTVISNTNTAITVSAAYNCLSEQISMTTQGGAINFVMSSDNNGVIIDWGNGTPVEKRTDTVADENFSSPDTDIRDIRIKGNLTALDCSGNRLTYLSVKDASGLQTLDCSNNNLTALDLSEKYNLRIVDCRNNNMSSAALNDLFTSLPTIIDENNAIHIKDNPGMADCDMWIAQGKGWNVLEN